MFSLYLYFSSGSQLLRLLANCGLQSCRGDFSSLLSSSLLAPWLISSWHTSSRSSSAAVCRAVLPYLAQDLQTSLTLIHC